MKERAGNVSRELTRRRFLVSGAALATTLQLQRAALAAGLRQETEVCRLAAEQEIGPYYVADELLRSDIVEKKPGIPLSLRILVLDARTCKPLRNAAVDIWHCDALGLYAGFTKQNPMGPGGHGGPPPGFGAPDPGHSGPPEGMPPPENHPTDKLTFLRGIQITDEDGAVNFKSVFPGFYMGRTNHIHFKVRIDGHAEGKTYAAGHTSHTGQVFFPEHVAAELMLHEPYKSHKIHRTTQAEDAVFTDQHGVESIAKVQPQYVNNFRLGMHADLVAVVDSTATPGPAQRRMGALGHLLRR